MYNWNDLKEYFKDSYRISQALQDVEDNGLVIPHEGLDLAGVLAASIKWGEDDTQFWSCIVDGLREHAYRKLTGHMRPDEKVEIEARAKAGYKIDL